MNIPRSEWIQQRDRTLAAAADALACLRAGDAEPAVRGWRLSQHPRLVEAAGRVLEDLPDATGGWTVPSAELSVEQDAQAPPWEHEARIHDRVGDGDPEVAVLARLMALAERIEHLERDAWRNESWRPQPERDAKTSNLWAAWWSGDAWNIRASWDGLFLPVVARTFRAVCASRKVPREVADRAVDDLRESFFYAMLGGGDGPPGWAEVAARALETSDPDPVHALTSVLGPMELGVLARGAATRGGFADTTAIAWHDSAEPLARARHLLALLEDAATTDALLDLHVLCRVVETWRSGATDPGTTWRVVRQNRGRARGRLRAIVAASPDSLLERVLGLDALYARTCDALRRHAWAWAWREMAGDFALDPTRAVTPPCEMETLEEEVFDIDREAIRTWVLLVFLRGRGEHLVRWVQTGSTGDRDSTWARLLTDALPPNVDVGDGKSRDYSRLRAALDVILDELLEEIRPVLADMAGLSPGRDLRTRAEGLLKPHWSGEVPLPRAGFPTFVKNAQSFVAERGAK